MSAPTSSPSGVTLFKKLWPMARPDGHLYLASLVSAPLLVALNLAQPYLLKLAADPRSALDADAGFKAGLNVSGGEITHPGLAADLKF